MITKNQLCNTPISHFTFELLSRPTAGLLGQLPKPLPHTSPHTHTVTVRYCESGNVNHSYAADLLLSHLRMHSKSLPYVGSRVMTNTSKHEKSASFVTWELHPYVATWKQLHLHEQPTPRSGASLNSRGPHRHCAGGFMNVHFPGKPEVTSESVTLAFWPRSSLKQTCSFSFKHTCLFSPLKSLFTATGFIVCMFIYC